MMLLNRSFSTSILAVGVATSPEQLIFRHRWRSVFDFVLLFPVKPYKQIDHMWHPLWRLFKSSTKIALLLISTITIMYLFRRCDPVEIWPVWSEKWFCGHCTPLCTTHFLFSFLLIEWCLVPPSANGQRLCWSCKYLFLSRKTLISALIHHWKHLVYSLVNEQWLRWSRVYLFLSQKTLTFLRGYHWTLVMDVAAWAWSWLIAHSCGSDSCGPSTFPPSLDNIVARSSHLRSANQHIFQPWLLWAMLIWQGSHRLRASTWLPARWMGDCKRCWLVVVSFWPS